MKYLSPIRLYEYCGIDLSDINLFSSNNVKSKLLEKYFQIGHNIIYIDNFAYDKDHALTEIDYADLKNNIQQHLLIWKNPILLNFLEEGVFTYISDWKECIDTLSVKRNLVNFISPYFASSFSLLFQNYYDRNDWANGFLPFSLLCFVNSSHQKEALVSTITFLNTMAKEFNSNAATRTVNIREIDIWTNLMWNNYMNFLPEKLNSEKDNLLESITNFSYSIMNLNIRKAYLISVRLVQTRNVSSIISEKIRSNHQIISEKHDKEYKKYEISYDNNNDPVWGRAGIGIAVLVLIVKILLIFIH